MSNVQLIGSKENKNKYTPSELYSVVSPRIVILSFNHLLHFRQLFKENRELRNISLNSKNLVVFGNYLRLLSKGCDNRNFPKLPITDSNLTSIITQKGVVLCCRPSISKTEASTSKGEAICYLANLSIKYMKLKTHWDR